MIAYATLGTNDLEKATKFYDALFAVMGAKRVMEEDAFIAWGTGFDKPMLLVTKPYDGKEATVGNGVMIALRVADSAQVDAVHKLALEMGGTCEGAPGPRGETGFYAGYFRDLDGNKLNACSF